MWGKILNNENLRATVPNRVDDRSKTAENVEYFSYMGSITGVLISP
jgi:hypothetical protein